MDKTRYQEARHILLEQLENLKTLREHITHHDQAFFGELPVEVKRKLSFLDRDINRLQIGEFKVAFVGGFSAGKSSLINALLGDYVVPESTEVTTAVPTYLRVNQQESFAEAHYLTKDEIGELDELFRAELADKFNIPEMRNAPAKELLETVQDLAQIGTGKTLVDNFAIFVEDKKHYQADARGRVTRLSILDAKKLVRDERKAMFLDRIELHLPMNIVDDVVLVDLPGVSVPNPRHRRLTFQFIAEEAHAVVFVLMASRLFDADESDVMEMLREGNTMMQEKTFWVLNRWDALSGQQRASTLEQFHHKLATFNLNNVAFFKTNALHGLLAQLALSQTAGQDSKLAEHMAEYSANFERLYGSHDKALQSSEVALLRQSLFNFLNNNIRHTTITSIADNTRRHFIEPLLYHLQSTKQHDEAYVNQGHQEHIQRTLRERINQRVTETQKQVKTLLREVRENVVSKRKTLFLGRAEELESDLRTIINQGSETDAYQAYNDIVADNKYRKYPYYFEIEIRVIDKLNSLLKESFSAIVLEQADLTYDELVGQINELIGQIGSEVGFDPEIMDALKHPMQQLKHEIRQQAKGVVGEKATLLDELLLYKPKGFFGFVGGNDIISGLEEAARLGTEHIKRTNESLLPEHMIPKTHKIRETLQEHYLDKVVNFREEIAESFWGQIRDILVDMEEQLLTVITGVYQTRLETLVRAEVEREFETKQAGTQARAKRFRETIEQLQAAQDTLQHFRA